jgi:signal peptidase I
VIRLAKALTLVTLVAALLTIAFQIVVVPTASMEGTVLVGDHLLVDRFAYGPNIPFTRYRLPMLKTVQRGDVVSFHPPGRAGEVYLKRVIAVGGDRVQWYEGRVLVDGVAERDSNVHAAKCGKTSSASIVPPGQLYVLGDNREHSEDSRYFGTVPEQNVIGEPVMVLWSFRSASQQWLRSRLAVYLDHPVTRLRWRRLFQKIG